MIGQRFSQAYTDVHVEVTSATSGGTAWVYETISGTPFLCGKLLNNSTDMFQFKAEMPHTRNIGSVLADIHYHYIIDANATGADQNVIWNISYCWLKAGDVMPATASWTVIPTITQVLTGTPVARTYGLYQFSVNLPCPVGETYGSMLFVQAIRGNGTYTGKIAIVDAGAHCAMDRNGSVNVTTD